jgi:flagellar export protein FliJ
VAGQEAQRVADQREQEAATLLQKARQVVEAARQDWLGARRGVRLLEQLKTRARARHQAEIMRAEQREQDDRRSGALWPVGDTVSEP